MRGKAGAQVEAGAEDRGGEEVPGELAGDNGIDHCNCIYFYFHLIILLCLLFLYDLSSDLTTKRGGVRN